MTFAEREKALLREHALGVLADPKAPYLDKVAARTRLISGDQKIDVQRLTGEEAGVFEVLLAKALGVAP